MSRHRGRGAWPEGLRAPLARRPGEVVWRHTRNGLVPYGLCPPEPVAAPGFATQMMAYDLLIDLRPSPAGQDRRLMRRYRRADRLLHGDTDPSGILV